VLGSGPVEATAVDELAEDDRLRRGDLRLVELGGGLVGGQDALP